MDKEHKVVVSFSISFLLFSVLILISVNGRPYMKEFMEDYNLVVQKVNHPDFNINLLLFIENCITTKNEKILVLLECKEYIAQPVTLNDLIENHTTAIRFIFLFILIYLLFACSCFITMRLFINYLDLNQIQEIRSQIRK